MNAVLQRRAAYRKLVSAALFSLLLPAVAPAADPDESAEVKKAREALQKLYALSEGEDVKCIKPPFPAERRAHLLAKTGLGAAAIDKQLKIQIWTAGPAGLRAGWGASRPDDEDHPLIDILAPLTGVRRCEMEGDGLPLLDARKARVDFIVREGAKPERLVEQLGAVLSRDLKAPVKLGYRNVEREVLVVSGKYKDDPLAGLDPKAPVELYGKLPIGEGRAFKQMGGYPGLLDEIGVLTGRPVQDEVKDPPDGAAIWCEYDPVFRLDLKEDLKALLDRVTEQTGLAFKQERRRVKVLFVERAD